MPTILIDDDLEVEFPFNPYDVQIKLMTNVVQCLKHKQNGLLESPTGTGKTLSLLCAALAWQLKQKAYLRECIITAGTKLPEEGSDPIVFQGVPKIIYSSRTHSQLSQAVQELKRSFYKKVKSVTLGSRDLLCIHPTVSKIQSSTIKNTACHLKVQKRTCSFHNEVSRKKEDPNLFDTPVTDIEDLVSRGQRIKFCPFFMSKELVKDADIVFMPYNYLLDPKIRTSQGIDIKNSVIILDEGHNISRICEEAVTFEIKSTIITQCIQELTEALTDYSEGRQQESGGESSGNQLTKECTLGGLIALKNSFLLLELKLQDLQASTEGVLHQAHAVLIKIIESGFSPITISGTINYLDVISSHLADRSHDTTSCEKFASILRVLAAQSLFIDPVEFGKSYKVFVEFEKKNDSNNGSSPKTFKFWCFNPAIGLQTMMAMSPRCVLLASGTLSPIPFLIKELGIPFPIQLSNPHIIGDNQLFACLVSNGPGGESLTSTFANRSRSEYLYSLGKVIVDVCSRVPHGVLVFFPSYSLLDCCQSSWSKTGILNNINQYKKLLLEPRGKDAFKNIINSYYTAAKTDMGACLMAVCRGKVAEGLDFSNEFGRAVIITGIPYAPVMDPQIKAKKNYLDQRVREDKTSINGQTWYQMEAIRALNQAIGRIIRHASDYGAIILCDSRCGGGDVKNYLSEWVKSRLQTNLKYDDTIRQLTSFFGSSSQLARQSTSSKNLSSLSSAFILNEKNLNDKKASSSSNDFKFAIPTSVPKRIKLMKKNIDYSTLGQNSDKKSDNSANDDKFTSVHEFYNWVNLVLNEEKLKIFQKATKVYLKERKLLDFARRILRLFTSEQFDLLEKGLNLVLTATEYQSLLVVFETKVLNGRGYYELFNASS